MRGARAVRRAILEGYPDADISVSMVWIDMLGSDTEDAARRWARTIDDPRVYHFYDPERRAGGAIAQSLGEYDKIAWDIYLFYDEGSDWVDTPPMPTHWMHQLQDSSWADAKHYHRGDDLAEELRRTMQRLNKI